MEKRYGKSDRIWVMDRGMVSEDNIDFLREGGRRYIVGTPKSMLKKFEAELLKDDWHAIRDGIEVKLCSRPDDEGIASEADKNSDAAEDNEVFILCEEKGDTHKAGAPLVVLTCLSLSGYGKTNCGCPLSPLWVSPFAPAAAQPLRTGRAFYFSALPRSPRHIGKVINAFGDERHRCIAHQEVSTSRVHATKGEGPIPY